MTKPRILYREDEDWIPHKGNRCPVHPETLVRAILELVGMMKHDYLARQLSWDGTGLGVTHYRIIAEAEAA